MLVSVALLRGHSLVTGLHAEVAVVHLEEVCVLVVGKYCPNGDSFNVRKFGLMAFSHEIHI